MEFTKFEKISLKHLGEKWVQDRIAEDPAALGLGENVLLKDKEKIQAGAGRLDLLLQDAEDDWRYEVEVQLGATDPSHIIRTIEYWDIERRRYPQYGHTAVIIAEDITSRFLNVVSLFNGMIPIMAIQMSALKNGNQVGLVFTTVVDQMSLGYDDEDEATYEAVDRAHWEAKRDKEIVAMADNLLKLAKQFNESWELNYNKSYISLVKDGRVNAFIRLFPKKNFSHLWIRAEHSEETTKNLENAGLDVEKKNTGYFIHRLSPGEIEKHKNILTDLVGEALAMKRSTN